MKKHQDRADPISLEDFADRLSHVQWHGHYISAECVYHSTISGNPMMVYDDGWFRCLSCGVQGSHQRLMGKLTGIPKPQTKETHSIIPPWRMWEKVHGSWQKAAKVAYDTAKGFPGLVSYIANRGMKPYLEDAKIGWLDGWYSFPVFSATGKLVDWVVRADPRKNTEVKYATRPRVQYGESHLYCPDWQLIEGATEIYLPFGMLDTWSIYACDLPTLTGITGWTVDASLLDDIRKTIYIIPDRGEDRGARKLRENLSWRGKILYLDYPDECNDPNSVLCKHGVNYLTEMITEAKSWIGKVQQKLHLDESLRA